MSSVIVVLACCTLLAAVNADQLLQYAQQSVKTKCSYPGFTQSNYCPSVPGAVQPGNSTSTGQLPALIGFGYNPVTKNIGLPVSLMSFNAKKTYGASGMVYSVADQVSLTPGNLAAPVRQVYNYPDHTSYFNDQINSFDGSCVGGMFAHSQDIESMFTAYFSGSKSLAVAQEYHELFTLTMSSGAQLDSIAAAAINWLPTTYNQALYFEFIQFWGSHYITKSTFGGMSETIVELASCVYSLLGTDVVAQNVQFDSANSMTPNTVPFNSYNVHYSASRKISSVDIVGGNPELTSPAQWAQRVQSFAANPVNLYFSYAPVSDLISDPTRKANMIRAAQEYIAAGASANVARRTVADNLNNNQFVQSKSVFYAEIELENLVPEDHSHQCRPGVSSLQTEVVNGKSVPICYWPPQVNDIQIGVIGTNGVINYNNINGATVCMRNAQGLVASHCLASNTNGPWVADGCSVCSIPASVRSDMQTGAEEYHCCINRVPTKTPVTAKYNVPASTLTLGCPAI